MMPINWSIILFLSGITFFITTAESNEPSKEIKPSPASECRVHIEKALEQYWDQSEPSNPNKLHIDQNINVQQQNNDEDAPEIQEQYENYYEDNVDTHDDNEEDESLGTEIQNNSCKDNSSTDETNNVEDQDEDEEDQDEDDEEDQDDDDERNKDEVEANKVNEEQDDENDEKDQEDEIGELGDENDSKLNYSNNVNKNTDNIEDDDETGDDDEEENEHPEMEAQEENETVKSSKESEANEIVDETEAEDSTDEKTIEMQIESDKVIEESGTEKPPFEQTTNTEETIDDSGTNHDTIENIYEEEEEEEDSGIRYRSRDHIDVILDLDEIATQMHTQNILKEIKKIYLAHIKPIELIYKYTDSTTRILGDAEIFNKPMLIFLGPWNAGKTTILNYLLGTERTPNALKTGTDFTVITYGETHHIRSGTELAADWRYAGVQRFGQDFLDHFRGVEIPHTLLKKITIVDTPGILENKKTAERGYSLNGAFQWFIDRSDAIYVVLDPSKIDIGAELGSVIDQLKGRDARFLLNKADTIRRSDLMRVVGQLFWNLSPLMSGTEAPLIYAVSLTTKPFHPSAPAKFLADQEKNLFYDMKDTLDKNIENRILYARRHAVRVRNHAKMIDCYLATYYRHKSIFSNKRNVAKSIIENPHNYNLFDGGMTNVSRYDLPNPSAYKEFFKLHPLYDFKPLASTCSYFRGCPMDKLDLAISKDIPELLAKYKKTKEADSLKHNR